MGKQNSRKISNNFSATRKSFFLIWMNLFYLYFFVNILLSSESLFFSNSGFQTFKSFCLLFLFLLGRIRRCRIRRWRRRRTWSRSSLSIGCHLLVSHFKELERGLLQLVDGLLDLFGVHAVLVGKLAADVADQVADLGHLLSGKLILKNEKIKCFKYNIMLTISLIYYYYSMFNCLKRALLQNIRITAMDEFEQQISLLFQSFCRDCHLKG